MAREGLEQEDLNAINDYLENVLFNLIDRVDYVLPFLEFQHCNESDNLPGSDRFHIHIVSHELQRRERSRFWNLFAKKHGFSIGIFNIGKNDGHYIAERTFGRTAGKIKQGK